VASGERRLPPGRLAETAHSGRYSSPLERQRIATLRERKLGVREIARRLGRSPSTISRELRRHLQPHDRGLYDGDLAHARARERSRRPRRPLLAREPELRQIVQDKLEEEWRPAQIAAHLRETYPDRPEWHLCHETIYQALYHGGEGGLSRTLTKKLRTGRPLRERRRSPMARTPRFIAPGRLIHARPAVVEERARIGDWEGDLISADPAARRSAPWSTGAPATCGWCTCPTDTALSSYGWPCCPYLPGSPVSRGRR
jgi:IS30 family transposase